MSDFDDDVEGEKALRDQVIQQRLSVFIDRAKEWKGCSLVAVLVDHNYPVGAAAVAAVGMDRAAAARDCDARMERTRARATGKELKEAEEMYEQFRGNPAAMVIMTAMDAIQAALGDQVSKGRS